jgi:ectoine hydroxylase-related dioxygenase (phytanoyl-CoA dioxygenase family)
MQVFDSITKKEFIREFNDNGYVVLRSPFDEAYLDRLRVIMLRLIDKEKELINRPDYKDYGFLLCAPYYAGEFPEIMHVFDQQAYLEPVKWILDEWFIVYLYTNNAIPPHNGVNKAVRIHVDTPRLIPGYNPALATLVTLDDFTTENGATWFLPGSHKHLAEPEEAEFYRHAERLIIPKGSVFYFNPRLWHAGGKNASTEWRNSIIVAYCRPWMKQRVDIPRFTGSVNKGGWPEHYFQLLGFRCSPPANFAEFYGEASERTFTQPFG